MKERTVNRTTQYNTPDTVTTADARLRITAFYRIAVNTGTTSRNYAYQELADELHAAAKAVMNGADAVDCLRDCAREWRMTAESCLDNKTGNMFRSWAFMIEDGVTS